jgi:serine/threonine-protein kinase
MKKAEAAAGVGQWFVAMDAAATAARIYPEEGARRLPAFAETIHAKLGDEPMIAISGRAVRLGEPNHAQFPARDVALTDFSIDPTEVTVEKYAVFCLMTNRTFPAAWGGRVPTSLLDHPVSWVTLEDARAYAAWIGRRLPTADEWELAARYVDERPYPWGPRFQLVADEPLRANTREFGLRRGGFVGGTMPVGQFPDGASPEGVMDLAGNVWEWTATTIDEKGFTYAVQKGGSFLTPEATARAANGLLEDPAQPHHDAGFRCAR